MNLMFQTFPDVLGDNQMLVFFFQLYESSLLYQAYDSDFFASMMLTVHVPWPPPEKPPEVKHKIVLNLGWSIERGYEPFQFYSWYAFQEGPGR